MLVETRLDILYCLVDPVKHPPPYLPPVKTISNLIQVECYSISHLNDSIEQRLDTRLTD